MSCSSCSAWMTFPAARKSSALKSAWVAKWNIPAEYAPMPTAKIISPIWDIVEYAMTRLMSIWLSAM